MNLIRSGDFYQIRGAEALRACRILNIAVTNAKGKGEWLCGIPAHLLDVWSYVGLVHPELKMAHEIYHSALKP